MNKLLLAFLYLIMQTEVSTAQDTLIKGVKVEFAYSRSIFPPEWQQAPINAYGESIDGSEITRTKSVILKSLNKYPEALLQKNLLAVYFVRQMKFYNVGYGGTNSNTSIYLVNNGHSMGYTDKYLEQTFHHEFSSILIRNYATAFDTSIWKQANDPSFNYNDPENGVGAIRNNQSSQDLDSLLSKRGLLTQYASSSIENDVNTIAQNLFTPDREFWNYVKRFPRIARKARLLMSFYQSIDPVFTEEYFRRFSR